MTIKIACQFLLVVILYSCQSPKGEYVCTPCNLPCDRLSFEKPGICPHCKMALIRKSDMRTVKHLKVNDIKISEGSGAFLVDGGSAKKEKTIKVFYHLPEKYGPNSRFLLVIPGAGRNAQSYRDAWIAESEEYGLVILSPMYQGREYDFEDYHLGGLAKPSNLIENVEYVENSNVAKLDEEEVSFIFNGNSDEWIFNDFDRIFALASTALNSQQTSYDIFGHSAGGHILHRLSIFQTDSKADRIVAANASFYTMPSFDYSFPFGLKNTTMGRSDLKRIFEKKLVVFLGEMDNENETRGTFLRSKSADEQGLHRLNRGRYFFDQAKKVADAFEYDFNWELTIVEGVGHDHRLMGDAVGKYLYEDVD